jgi:hypothetical protein
METLQQVGEIIIAYASGLIFPVFIAYGSLIFYHAKTKPQDVTLRKFRSTLNFPQRLVLNVFMTYHERHFDKRYLEYLSANFIRLLGTVIYVIIIIGLEDYARFLWEENVIIPSIICASVGILSIIHLIEAWRFGYPLKDIEK